MTADGRVFAHGDEDGTVYQLDPRSGRVTKRFALAATGDDPDLGKKVMDGRLAGDFEDIAIVGDRFFLVSSNGVLLEFAEGEDGGSVPYRAYPTGLEKVCEVEGLAFDSSAESLLLLCKTMREKSERQQVVVYAWSLADRSLGDKPRLAVPWSALARATGGKGFNGSALAVTPGGQSLLMVAGPQQLFAEVGLGRRAAARWRDGQGYAPSAGESRLPAGRHLAGGERRRERRGCARSLFARAAE